MAHHVPELANFAAGSLLFGQLLSEEPYSLKVALVGLFSYALLMGLALFFARSERR